MAVLADRDDLMGELINLTEADISDSAGAQAILSAIDERCLEFSAALPRPPPTGAR